MKYRISGLLLLLILFQNPQSLNGSDSKVPGFPIHDFYLSHTLVEYNQETQSLEISIKAFTDDLEEALKNLGAPRLDLGLETEHEDAEKLLFAYLKASMVWEMEGKRLNLSYIGKEAMMDATWCYLEIKNVDANTPLKLKYTLLTESFKKQINMVNIFFKGEKQTLRFDARKRESTISLRQE